MNRLKNFNLKIILISGFTLSLVLFSWYLIGGIEKQMSQLDIHEVKSGSADRRSREVNINDGQALPSTPSVTPPSFKPIDDTSEQGTKNIRGSEIEKQKKLIGLFNEKKFQEALDYAETINKNSGAELKHWIASQMPVLLTALGWKYIEEKACVKAISLFKEALILRDEREASRGLMVCAFEAGNKDEVLALSEKFLARFPDDQLVARLRAEALESEGRFDEAKDLFRGDAAKKMAFEKRSKLAEKQSRANGNHFQITFESEDQEYLVDSILDFLEDTLSDFNQWGFSFPAKLIEVVLYKKKDFSGVSGGQPSWAEGLFDGRMRIPVPAGWQAPQKELGFGKVLRHELTHALLHESNNILPVWIDEGLAQRMACMPYGCEGAGGHSKFHSLSVLEGSFMKLSGEDARTAYQQSLYLVYSMEARLGRGIIRDLIESALIGGDSKSIFERFSPGGWNQFFSETARRYEQGIVITP